MKKLLTAMLTAVLISSPLYAGDAVSYETHPYRISDAEMMYMYWNDADEAQHFRLYVNPLINNKTADIVTVKCNGNEIYAVPGTWTSCNVMPHKPVSFLVSTKNFINGAEGVSERFY